MDSLTNHVFATLTYSHEIGLVQAWEQLGKDFNRYIQVFRRKSIPNEVQYIRTIEAHGNGYPHIHVILQFKDPIRVQNARYFENSLYRRWKIFWKCGLSDYQPPRNTSHPIFYLIKYISKDTPTIKTLWKKLYASAESVDTSLTQSSQKQSSAPTAKSTGDNSTTLNNIETLHMDKVLEEIQEYPKSILTLFFCKYHHLKQLSWSRRFVFGSAPRPSRSAGGLEDYT